MMSQLSVSWSFLWLLWGPNNNTAEVVSTSHIFFTSRCGELVSHTRTHEVFGVIRSFILSSSHPLPIPRHRIECGETILRIDDRVDQKLGGHTASITLLAPTIASILISAALQGKIRPHSAEYRPGTTDASSRIPPSRSCTLYYQ
jgi:hypothetical protein